MITTADASQPAPPLGRYGGDDARADRRLRRLGVVCGTLFALFVLGMGTWYILQAKVNGEIITFQVDSDTEVRAHLAVDKDNGTAGTCTLRSLATDQLEVGRVTVPIPAKGGSYDTIVTIKTVSRATDAELVSCSAT